MKKILSLCLLLLFFETVTSAQDSVYARRIIKALTSEAMHGRGVSHQGDSVAAHFLANELKQLGVLPLQVDYFQRFSYNCYGFAGPVSLTINGKELQPYSQYRVFSSNRFKDKIPNAKWKKQLKDGTWIFSADKLDTYTPIVGNRQDNPICIQVLDSVLPKRVKRIDADIPVQFHNNHWSQNVVGYVKGVVDSMIVYTAHYDHCGTMGDGITFYGAHDNASGVAAVMDIARIACQKTPYYTLVFMFFSAEESGLIGSKYAVEHPLIDFSKVKLLCNIDMFCGGDEGMMVFNAKSDNTKDYFNRLKSYNDESKVALEIRPRENRPNSDHWYFSTVCPSLFFLTMGGPYGGYHDPADTCDGCGLGHYNDFLSLILQLTNL